MVTYWPRLRPRSITACVSLLCSGRVAPTHAGLLVVLALLGGCAEYHPQPISAAATAAAIDARSLDEARLRTLLVASEGGTPERWGLPELTLAALYYHPDIDIARAKLAKAKAGVVTAGQVPNPSLSFEELSYNATVGTWTIAPVINFLIETGAKRGHRTAEAQALVQAARDDLATAAWQVRGEVRNALLDLWAAQRRQTILRRRLDLQDQLVRLLEHRFAIGQASALDVARERTGRNQVSLAIRDAERQDVEARTRLVAAIGIPLHGLDNIALSFDAFDKPELPEMVPGTLRREALVGRSDVQALLAEYAAAEAALRLQVANQYPNISLSPGYAYDAGQDKYMLLPAVDLPVFNQNQGPIAEAEARRQEIAARFTALQTQIITAVDGATAGYRAAAQAVKTARALLAGEEDRASRTARSFQAGAVDRPTMISAQAEQAAAEEQDFDATLRQRQALGAVEDALQHPFFGSALPVLSDRTSRQDSDQ